MGENTAMEALYNSAQKVMDQVRATVHEAGLAAEAKLVESVTRRIASAIVEEVQDWPADLIAIGTHGRRGFHHLGSVAERVIRTVSMPVLLIHGRRGHSAAIASVATTRRWLPG
ncbi:MAG: universal stress protein [Gammaproteobacteria bacterium]|nr:universal stress protein [Gammaproteobacteria bacterium]